MEILIMTITPNEKVYCNMNLDKIMKNLKDYRKDK